MKREEIHKLFNNVKWEFLRIKESRTLEMMELRFHIEKKLLESETQKLQKLCKLSNKRQLEDLAISERDDR